MEVAVLILTHGRVELLIECLKSIENQRENPFKIEYYILLNGKDEKTASWLNEQKLNYRSLNNPLPVGEARNLLIKDVKQDYICFLDDDITLPLDYFSKAHSFIQNNPGVDIFGGPDQSGAKSSGFQNCLGHVMESFLATGPTNKRHKVEKDGAVEEADETTLILCNFWAKRNIFKTRGFPKHFRRNEENYLLSILKDEGHIMMRVPHLYLYHNRKTSLFKIMRVLFLAGIYRSVSIVAYPKSFRPWFIAHHVFLCALFGTAFWSPLYFYALLGIYLLAISVNSLSIFLKTKRVLDIPTAMLLFVIFNFSYPVGQTLGYAVGGVARLRGKSFDEEIL